MFIHSNYKKKKRKFTGDSSGATILVIAAECSHRWAVRTPSIGKLWR